MRGSKGYTGQGVPQERVRGSKGYTGQGVPQERREEEEEEDEGKHRTFTKG